jgi:hypothetical protein
VLHTEHTDEGQDPAARRFIDRRTVLRTAAWALPAIQVVSAAPVFAASGAPALSLAASVLGWSSTTVTGTLQLQVTISNTGGTAATQPRVTLTFPARWNPTTTTPAGWTVTGSRTSTVVYTPPGSAAAPSTP